VLTGSDLLYPGPQAVGQRLLNPEDSHNECTTRVSLQACCASTGSPEVALAVPEGPLGRESGPRPKARAATLTISLSAQDAASLNTLASLIERALRGPGRRLRQPQSGHHSSGATSSSPTFIHSSTRWSLQVHSGPIRPSASIPVALCTRVNARPHPALEQKAVRSVMSCCAQSGSNVIPLWPTSSPPKKVQRFASVRSERRVGCNSLTGGPRHRQHAPVDTVIGRDRGHR